jgi:hypothetical protein
MGTDPDVVDSAIAGPFGRASADSFGRLRAPYPPGQEKSTSGRESSPGRPRESKLPPLYRTSRHSNCAQSHQAGHVGRAGDSSSLRRTDDY